MDGVVQQRIPSLIDPPITFAHRGARAHAPENTIEAFELALKLGASGLESDVWTTADGVPVLEHDGVIRKGLFRRTPIGELRRDELPEFVPSLGDLLDACGTGYELSLDLKDRTAGPLVIDAVREREPAFLERLWLCHPDFEVLEPLRALDERVKLVDSTRLGRIDEGPERRGARLAELGIDAINMRQPDWNGGLVTLFHRFGVRALMWDVQHEHHLRPAFRMGIDGVFSDHVDRMTDAFDAEIGG